MYKITKVCTQGNESEINPVGESLKFVRVAYTDDEKVADYYRRVNKIGVISIEEIDE